MNTKFVNQKLINEESGDSDSDTYMHTPPDTPPGTPTGTRTHTNSVMNDISFKTSIENTIHKPPEKPSTTVMNSSMSLIKLLQLFIGHDESKVNQDQPPLRGTN